MATVGRGMPSARWAPAFEMWWLLYLRTWKGNLISRFLLPVLFLVSMGVVLGDLVDERTGGVGGVPYLQFVVPGILAAQAMWSAMSESTYSVTGAIRWNMGYHAMLATPLGVGDVLLGHLLYVTVSVSMATVVFVLVGALFGAWVSWWVVAAVPVVVLTGMAFSVPCFALSAMLRDNVELGYTVLFRFVMTPLFLFSGTFFPVDQLPAVLQPVAWVTPLWHGVEVSRDLALGAPDWGAVALHTAYLVLLVMLSSVWALRAFRRRLVV
ncbi:ABC transporter permease [Ornithinimicrobium sediminis]|uniref:ABC transporter permease n=1 Tax=Ornithinimicrobium sediminis TaxID=2904603 RepID=UPI001E5B4A47|nr:ABC transporter permease [Ornithinimicrobium sediminis]MCE0485321.1 ABC transporter permease [Ornithinimicrobium sediminis]